MKLHYITNARIPTEKAHGIQIMKTCEALSKQGVEVELVVPKRKNKIKEDPFDFYSVEKKFKITKLWNVDFLNWSIFKKLAFWKQSTTFTFSAVQYVRKAGDSIIYTRDLLNAAYLPSKNLFYEVHSLPEKLSPLHKRAYKRVKKIIAISNGLKEDLIKFGVPGEKITVIRDAVDLNLFHRTDVSKEMARKSLGLDQDETIVLYTGHLYKWKGVDTLARAARQLPEDVLVYFVGGTAEDADYFDAAHEAPNLRVIGWRKQTEIPFWLIAADVLVLPTSAEKKIGAKYTSPLKAFEYMTAGRPIVASDTPSLHEVLDSRITTFVDPDSPEALKKGIEEALDKDVPQVEIEVYSWDKRAKDILNVIK